jgi:hypothetical protein
VGYFARIALRNFEMSMTIEPPSVSPGEPEPQLSSMPIDVPDYATPGLNGTEPAPDFFTPDLCSEPRWYRNLWLAMAVVIIALFGRVVFGYFAGADSGVDQNAYLVSGRMLAQNGSLQYRLPASPDSKLSPGSFAYVGGMYVRVSPATTADGKPNPESVYYPKYPFGLPLLYACFFWAFKLASVLPILRQHVDALHADALASYWAFIVSPASAALAVAGMFFLARQVSGSFAAALAAILLGTSQLTLMLADNPNSHASCMAFIVWGMFFCVRWMQTGSYWRGILGGLLVGYAATIRYNEILLFVAMCVVVLSRLPWNQWKTWLSVTLVAAMAGGIELLVLNSQNSTAFKAGLDARWSSSDITLAMLSAVILIIYSLAALTLAILRLSWADWRMYIRALVPGLAWAVPVGILLLVNKHTMGSTTGYDSTHESEFGVAFQWRFFWQNWEKVIREFYDLGLFFVVPFAVAGVFMLFRRSWRIALLLIAWVVPGVMLYMSYYWSPDFADAYARFFLTYLPALLVGAAVCFHDGILAGRKTLDSFDNLSAKVAAGTMMVWLAPGLLFYLVYFWRNGHDNVLAEIGLIYAPMLVALAALAVHEIPLVTGPARRPISSAYLAISAGMVVLIASGISTYRTMHGLRDGSPATRIPLHDFRDRLALAETGQILLDTVPAKSVLFAADTGGIATPANYIQFIRDWEVYSADAFSIDGSRRGMGGGGNRRNQNGRGGGRGNFGGPPGGGPGGGGPGGGGMLANNNANAQNDPNAVATPVQPEQQDYHASLYRNQSPRQLFQLEADVVNRAFAEHRRVFVVIAKDKTSSTEERGFNLWGGENTDPMTTFKENLSDAGKYSFKTLGKWEDVALPEEKEEDLSLTDNSPMGGGRGGRGGFNAGMARMFMGSDRLFDWQLVEITPWDPKDKTVEKPANPISSQRRRTR